MDADLVGMCLDVPALFLVDVTLAFALAFLVFVFCVVAVAFLVLCFLVFGIGNNCVPKMSSSHDARVLINKCKAPVECVDSNSERMILRSFNTTGLLLPMRVVLVVVSVEVLVVVPFVLVLFRRLALLAVEAPPRKISRELLVDNKGGDEINVRSSRHAGRFRNPRFRVNNCGLSVCLELLVVVAVVDATANSQNSEDQPSFCHTCHILNSE